MSNSPLYNSPSRANNVKRKMPDTFYRPPVLKTQLFSAEVLQRPIHHSHTHSLPVETPNLPQTNNLSNSSGSISNIFEKSMSIQPTNNINYSFNDQTKQPYSPHIPKQQEQQYFHSKTYSLPVSFEPNNLMNSNSYLSNSQNFAPPVRNTNPNGDIPLPPGWECEKASNGQYYYINHFTKTTTWEDPRKLYNLPTNQSEINNDLRSTITKTIPLPSGWEEARTANGEVYYINHTDKTTCWEDPRINIYMQQQQQKFYTNQQFNMKSNYNNTYNMVQNQNYNNNNSHYLNSPSSNSSLSSSALSIASSSSSQSISSLNNSHPNNYIQNESIPINQYNNQQYQLNKNLNKNEQHILNLKKSLDEVIKQKKSICKQLEELSKQETNYKSKLSPKDLDDVLKMLKINDTKMDSFTHLDQAKIDTKTQSVSSATTPLKADKVKVKIEKNSESINNDLDSTFVAETSVSNSSKNNTN